MKNLPEVAKEYGIEEKKATDLTKGLNPILKERESLIIAFDDVSELEINEENIPEFKALRLQIQKNRTQGINKWHKASKEFFLAGGRFVDAIKNKENQINEEMESKLMDAEKHFENLEKERVNKLQLSRSEKLSKYVEDISHIDLGNMDSDIWDAYYNAKKSEYEKRIEEEKKAEEARAEKERLDKLESSRKAAFFRYEDFSDNKNPDLRNMSEEDYIKLMDSLQDKKAEYNKKQEKIRKENERLKKEREAKEKQREKRSKELQRYIQFIRDYNKLINEPEKEYRKQLEEIKKGAEDHWEFERKEQIRKQKEEENKEAQLKKEREAREKLEAKEKQRKESEAKKLAEEKAERERLEKAPVKEKLNKWVNDFELPETSVNNKVSKEIIEKFEAFKKWSINQVNNL